MDPFAPLTKPISQAVGRPNHTACFRG